MRQDGQWFKTPDGIRRKRRATKSSNGKFSIVWPEFVVGEVKKKWRKETARLLRIMATIKREMKYMLEVAFVRGSYCCLNKEFVFHL